MTTTTHRAGPGYILLFLATIFKFFDLLAHLIVPTPHEKHQPAPSTSVGSGHPWYNCPRTARDFKQIHTSVGK